MSWFVQTVITGITAFVATNIDDLIILIIFFTQINNTFRPQHIVVGQYIGFAVLLAASLPGFFGGLVLPKAWIGLLGLVPIAIGIKHLIDPKDDEQQIQMVSNELSNSKTKQFIHPIFTSLLAPHTYQVAVITFANGGDNIGIYVPLFANSNFSSLGVTLGVFLILTGAWCFVAYQLTRHSTLAKALTHYGEAIVPFVLIGLGIFILIDSGTYHLLPGF